MAKAQTRLWDASEHLENEEDMVAYLEAALQEGDPALVAAALGDIARVYKALSPEGNPSFATVMKVCKALGLKLHTEPAV